MKIGFFPKYFVHGCSNRQNEVFCVFGHTEEILNGNLHFFWCSEMYRLLNRGDNGC